MNKTTLFDKIWDSHIVKSIEDGPDVLYIDQHYIHEVTSPQAFEGIQKRGLKVFRPEKTLASPDHNIPTENQHLPIKNEESAKQISTLINNCKKNDINIFNINNPNNGIIHVIGPELGYTQIGMTIVCGDSHTSTHGAFGNIAFGIGTSEVEMVFASQCIMQPKPKKMRISINGELNKGVSAKDLILYIISQIGTDGGTGHFCEFAGSTIESLSMESRMTICNMSIEMGARGGLIAPDKKTFEYLYGRDFGPSNKEFNDRIKEWEELKTDKDAVFDLEYNFDAKKIEPMITYGTNPGMGCSISTKIPSSKNRDNIDSYNKALKYMNFSIGDDLLGKKIDYIFLGSCTNGRIEDLRAFTEIVKGRKKADSVVAWIVPGSKRVEKQAYDEGLVEILEDSGFKLRQPGCSACLAMNEDKIPEGKYCVSTSNRNFEGRQGTLARTLLASPYTAAACAISGKITDPRDFL